MTDALATFRRVLACVGLLLVLACCDATDPYMRDGTWRPSPANDENLRAMVASPSDLVRGVGDLRGDGQQAAAALDRQRQDKMRDLPESAIAKIVPIQGGSGDVQGSH